MINKKYLNKQKIVSLREQLHAQKPIQYIAIPDFLDKDFFDAVSQEVQNTPVKRMQQHTQEHHRNNSSVYLAGVNLQLLFDFFNTDKIDKFFYLLLEKKLRQEFYVNTQEIEDALGDSFSGAIAQEYTYGDFFDWHIDGPIEKGSLGAFTYYLGSNTGDWDESFGGNLEFGVSEDNTIRSYESIPYKANTLVFIAVSPIAYHRVSPITQKGISRFSVQSTLFKT